MKIKVTKSFLDKLNKQIDYIARDKPKAARKFKNDLLNKIREISKMPLRYRKSIFFDRNDIRDLIFKGYIVVFKINKEEDIVEIFGLTKHELNPFK